MGFNGNEWFEWVRGSKKTYYGMQFFPYASVFIKINEYLRTQLVHIRRNSFHLLSKPTLWCHLKVHCAKIVKHRIATFLHLVECAPILHKHCTTFVSIRIFYNAPCLSELRHF